MEYGKQMAHENHKRCDKKISSSFTHIKGYISSNLPKPIKIDLQAQNGKCIVSQNPHQSYFLYSLILNF